MTASRSKFLVAAILLTWAAYTSAERSVLAPRKPAQGSMVSTAAEPQGLFDALGKASHTVKTVGELVEMHLGTGADATNKMAHDLHDDLQRRADSLEKVGSKWNDALSDFTDKAAGIGQKAATGMSETAEKLANLFKPKRAPQDPGHLVVRPHRGHEHHPGPRMQPDHMESSRVDHWEDEQREMPQGEREAFGREQSHPEHHDPEAREHHPAHEESTRPSKAHTEQAGQYPSKPRHLPKSLRTEAFDWEGTEQPSKGVRKVPASAKAGLSYTQAKRAALKQAKAEGLVARRRPSTADRRL